MWTKVARAAGIIIKSLFLDPIQEVLKQYEMDKNKKMYIIQQPKLIAKMKCVKIYVLILIQMRS